MPISVTFAKNIVLAFLPLNFKIVTPVVLVNATNQSNKRDHCCKSGDSAQPLVSLKISNHQVKKHVVQADASDGSGKSQNISHDSHNNKLSDNTFDIQRESRVLLKLEISNMNKPVPVLKSKVGS